MKRCDLVAVGSSPTGGTLLKIASYDARLLPHAARAARLAGRYAATRLVALGPGTLGQHHFFCGYQRQAAPP